LKKVDIIEATITLVPVDPRTRMVSAKDLRFPEHVGVVIDEVTDLLRRSEAIARLREADGKGIGAEHKDRLAQLLEEMGKIQKALSQVLGEGPDTTAADRAEIERERSRFLRLQSSLTATSVGQGHIYAQSNS